MNTQKHAFHQLCFNFFLHVAHATMCALSMHVFLQKTFFSFVRFLSFPVTPVIDRHKFQLMIGTKRQKIMPSVRVRACLMDRLLCKLCAEKSENAIDETHVFACSHECFKLDASPCVCFVEHLTTHFCGFATLAISTDETCCCRMMNEMLLKD